MWCDQLPLTCLSDQVGGTGGNSPPPPSILHLRLSLKSAASYLLTVHYVINFLCVVQTGDIIVHSIVRIVARSKVLVYLRSYWNRS